MSKGMSSMAIIGAIIGVVVFVALLPVLFNTISPTYTLNTATNDSVTLGASSGTTTNYPINGELTLCANNTHAFTIPAQCNVTDADTGTFGLPYAGQTGSVINVSYSWEDPSYLDNTTERRVAQYLFTMVLLGLLMVAMFVTLKGV
jgi:hypothetical protein